jgi:hypothetical protein
MNSMKNLAKITLVFAVFAFTFSQARPVKAFYLELSPEMEKLLAIFKSNRAIAQDAGTMMPAPGTQYTIPPQNTQQMPYPNSVSYPSGGDTCKIDGVERPGSCDQYNNQSPMPSGQGQYMGPSPEEQKQNNQRQLQDMKRGMKQTERPIKEFERMIQNAEKKGATVPDELKQKLEKMKAMLESVKNAATMDEMKDIDMSEMGDLMQSMEDFRRDVVEKQQRVEGMRRGMRGMEQGLKMFKSQVARLIKSKVSVPSDVTDNIAKLEAVIAQVKTAKTTEEIDAIDFESLQDLMQNMDESRQKLEQLARWPQTLKDINRQLAQLQREQKRAKSIADRLAKKGMDAQDLYVSFADAINKLKSVRDAAVEKMSAGDGEGAFDLIENEFYGQMEDVWQHFKVLNMMANFGQFTAESKRKIAQAQLTINRLKRQKKDTSELETLLQQAKDKSNEIQAIIKSKDFDGETIQDAFEEMENIGQEFDNMVAELTGQEVVMPWEKGPQQFRRVEMSPDVQKFIPQKPTVEQIPQSTPAPMEAPKAELEIIESAPMPIGI